MNIGALGKSMYPIHYWKDVVSVFQKQVALELGKLIIVPVKLFCSSMLNEPLDHFMNSKLLLLVWPYMKLRSTTWSNTQVFLIDNLSQGKKCCGTCSNVFGKACYDHERGAFIIAQFRFCSWSSLQSSGVIYSSLAKGWSDFFPSSLNMFYIMLKALRRL